MGVEKAANKLERPGLEKISGQKILAGQAERMTTLEKKPEVGFLNKTNLENQEKSSQPFEKATTSQKPSSQPVADPLQKRAAAIDDILAEGLNEIFLNMTPEKQMEFKREGEKTVRKINLLLNGTRIRINKIIKLIEKWLRLIPGVNRFFLVQEAKIKADRIINIKNKF